MGSRSGMVLLSALALAAPAYAQNKCVDEKGRVTYQQDPCPGQVRAPAKPRPAYQPSAGAPAAAPASAAPTGENAAKASMRLRVESHEMEMCAGTWDNIAGRLEFGRKQIARAREQGRDVAREEMLAMQDRQNMMAQWLPGCAKYGFQDLRDPQAEQRNSAVAKELFRKIEANGAEIEAIGQRDIAAREAASRAQQTDSDRKECEVSRRQVAEAKAMRSQVPPQQLAKFDQDIAKAEREIAQACPPR